MILVIITNTLSPQFSIVTDLHLPAHLRLSYREGIIFHFRDSDRVHSLVLYRIMSHIQEHHHLLCPSLALIIIQVVVRAREVSLKKDGVDVTESTSESFEKVIHLGGFKSRKAKKTISRPEYHQSVSLAALPSQHVCREERRAKVFLLPTTISFHPALCESSSGHRGNSIP